MKRILLLLAVFGFACAAHAREQWITGFVYGAGTAAGMPFASVWLLDPQTEEPLYGAITSVNGWYDLGNVEMGRIYILKVTAPGCETLVKKVKPKYFEIEGNQNYHIPIERSENAGMLMPERIYDPAQIAADAERVEDFYGRIPGIIYEDGYFTDSDGANIRLMFSGYVLDQSAYEEFMGVVTPSHIKAIEYYDLSGTDMPYYDGILNFEFKEIVKINALKITRPLSPDTSWDI